MSIVAATTKHPLLSYPQDDAIFQEVIDDMSIPAFRPVDGVKIATTEAEAKEQNGNVAGSGSQLVDVDAQCDRLLSELPRPASMPGYR